MGTVIDNAYEDYERVESHHHDGHVLYGGATLTDGDLSRGY